MNLRTAREMYWRFLFATVLLAASVDPPPLVFSHRHAAGEQAHVHGDEPNLHDDSDSGTQRLDSRENEADTHLPRWQSAGRLYARHWHLTQPYCRVLPPPPVTLTRIELVRPWHQPFGLRPPHGARFSNRTRGPPL